MKQRSLITFFLVAGMVAGALAQAPAVPVLSLPANGATSQLTTVSLTWNAVSGAQKYYFEVSTSINMPSSVDGGIEVLVGNSSSVSNLLLSTTYYWRVASLDGIFNSAWSGTWSFTTAAQIAPAAPTLSLPANNARGQSRTLTLSWGTVSGGLTYGVQVSTTSSFATTFLSQTALTVPTKTVTGLPATTTYFWRANAKGAILTGKWSSVWSFATGNSRVLLQDESVKKESFTLKNGIIKFEIVHPVAVEISLCNLQGKSLAVRRRTSMPGSYSIPLKDFHLATGLYLLQFEAAEEVCRASVIIEPER